MRVRNEKDKDMLLKVGRTKAVATFRSIEQHVGVIMEVTAKAANEERTDRIRFSGPVTLDVRARTQLESTLVPIVDQAVSLLGLHEKYFDLSGVNLGSAASMDRGVGITGFSADLPILISLLSAALEVPVRQDVVCTGHIASPEGDIRPVRGITQKIEAAIAAPTVSAIVIPDLDKDRSFEVLTPIEYESAIESVARYKGDIRIHACGDVLDVVKVLMPEEAIVTGGLRAGFFRRQVAGPTPESRIRHLAWYLTEGNERRFWQALEHSLLNHDREGAKRNIQAFADFHIVHKNYPSSMGEQLSRLLISLPPSVIRLDDLFPLASMEQLISLSQLARPEDYQDVRQLYKAAFGEGLERISRSDPIPRGFGVKDGNEDEALLDTILAEISEETLAERVGKPLDEARGRYVFSPTTVSNGFEFNEAVTAFYTHLFRHAASPIGHMEKADLSRKALDLVEQAFRNDGGYKGALAEAEMGIHGGMRKVFDLMTEYQKQDEKQKYVAMVFKRAIDARDWDGKVRLMKVFLERVRPDLPSGLKDLPPKQLANHWETVIRYYSQSMAQVKDFIRKL